MTIAIYGGSFNPPHLGHAMVIAWLLWTERVDAVWLVPTFSHALGKQLTPFDERVRLCEALCARFDEKCRVERIEESLPPPSYTIDTLLAFTQRHPSHRFQLVIGADILEQTDQWSRWEQISERFCPIVVGRAGYQSPEGGPVFPNISSSEIRRRVVAKASIEHLVLADSRADIEALYGACS